MSYLILVRHGRSEWNDKGLWTGWTDIDMTDAGKTEVEKTAQLIKDLPIDIAYQSPLKRSKETLAIILQVLNIHPSISEDAAITERSYGIYTGKNKWQIKEQVGEDEFRKIRRSFSYHIPEGESLEQVYQRVVPFYQNTLLPQLMEGKNILISGHGNSLRALVKYLDGISDDAISDLEITTGEAIIYAIDSTGTIASKEIRGKNAKHV